jgi:hypothetical protein
MDLRVSFGVSEFAKLDLKMVRSTGFEPVTTWMSTKDSTAELTSHIVLKHGRKISLNCHQTFCVVFMTLSRI